MSKLSLKSLLLVSIFCLLFVAAGATAFAQCDGFYYKPTTRKLLNEKVYFADYSNYLNPPPLYADFTGDGIGDLIGLARNDANTAFTKVYILPIDGTGNFGTPIQVTLPAPIQPQEKLRIGDYNSDGKKDFFVTLETNPITSVIYKNNGNGTFTALNTNILSVFGSWVDVNSDGISDIFTTGAMPNTPYYRPGNIDGSFGEGIPLTSARYEFPADFNADGKIDFPVTTYNNSTVSLQYYINLGNGIFVLNGEPTVIDTNFSSLVKVADFNNDGRSDFVFAGGGSGFAGVFFLVLTLPNGGFSRIEIETNPAPLTGVFYADYNNDNLLDILIQRGTVNSQYKLLTNNGDGTFTATLHSGGDSIGTPIGDLDGDHRPDFILFNNYDYQLVRKIFNETQLTVVKSVCSKSGQTKIVDFNGDGLADPVYWRESDGRWRYRLQRDQSGSVNFNWGQIGDIPTLGDYDGDGKTDIAVFRPSNGTWYYVNSSNGALSSVAFGANGDRPVPSDYNGDSITDFAVYRPSTGAWYVLYSGTNQFYGATFGASEDKPVPADYDGDGKTDFAVFRPSNGFWYVLKSSDNSFFGMPWGISSDTLVPADYDGDGKADIAIMRSGTPNAWYIYRSSNGQAAGFAFGVAEDIAQASDWDGNGIADAGVFRTSVNNWYGSFSPNGFSNFIRNTGEVPIASLNRSY